MSSTMSANFLSVFAVGIAGRVRLHEKLGAPEVAQAVDRCIKRIVRAVETFEGRVVQNSGEEIIAEFSTAADALHAAVETQRSISDVKMATRIGLSCGEVSNGEALTREAARLVGLAKPGQSLAAGRLTPALPESLRAQVIDTSLMLTGGSEPGEPVVEIVAASFAPEAVLEDAASLAENGQQGAWLSLRYGENTLTLDEHRPAINMGRESACDLVIRDGRASRRHATIKRRGDLVVLIDKSRNGTYVTVEGEAEQFVRESECALHGRGIIAFANSASAPDADCAEFECGTT